ncbi:MAG: hypothetical protein ACK4SO_02075 [Candidatus Kapaibacteriota bacterium]
MEQKNLNQKQLEELLPDYVFGRLNSNEKELFEKSIQNFPELIKEVENVRNVFSRLQDMDLDRFLDMKTKNIPVQVSQRLYRKTNPLNFLAKPAFVSVVAGLGVVLLIVSILFTRINKDKNVIDETITRNNVAENVPYIFPELDDIANLALFENETLSDIPELYLDNFSFSAFYSEVEDLEEIVNENLVELIGANDLLFTVPFNHNSFKNFENLDETDFQQIIEELKNVEL